MANLTITKLSDGFFDFQDDNGNNFGGNNITYSYYNTDLKFNQYTYRLDEISYNNGTETIGFSSVQECIYTLKTDGFTGNFNSGGATPQVINYSDVEVNTGQTFFGASIYAKVYQGNFIEGNQDIDISGNSIDKYLKHELFYLSSDGLYMKSFINPSINAYSKIDARKGSDGDYVSIYNLSEDLTTLSYLEVGQPFYLTIYYTKL